MPKVGQFSVHRNTDGEGGYNSNGLSNNDTISGGEGNDYIDGQSGADTLYGGAGDDVIYGGDNGAQTDYFDPASNTWIAMSNNDLLDGGEGNDQLYGQQGDDVLLGGAGTDNLDGGDGNDILDGGTGLDVLTGGAGDDTYVVDGTYGKVASSTTDECGDAIPGQTLQWTTDTVNELGGEGYDIVKSHASYTLTENVEELQLVFDVNTATTAPQYYADLMAYGQDGTGNALDNRIIGNDLNNRIDGGLGADTMIGGAGNDTYVIDNAGDVIIEQVGGGIDTVESNFSYSLAGSNLENLTLQNGALDGQGNTADNILTGNAADNVLQGMDGNDTLMGGLGNDTLLGGAGDDRYVFRLNDGSDVIDDTQGNNILFVGNDLTVANLEAKRVGDDVLLSVIGTADSVLLKNWFTQTEGVNRIEFCDGSGLDRLGIAYLINRPPVANADAMTVFEDGGVVNIASAALLANDTDPDVNDALFVVAVGGSAVGANVLLANGQVQYDIGNRFQELGAGQTLMDNFSYTITDRYGATASSVVNVTITGVNDAPVTTADDATALQEDATLATTGNVLVNDSDIDQGTVLTVANAGTFVGAYGTLTLNADGSYRYRLKNASVAVQSLAQGQVVTETFAYQATDGIVSTPSTLTVTITGTNDAPVTTVDAAAVQEDLSISATGNVLTNDSDVDQGTVLSVANAGVFAGQYGQLTLQADGSYTYALDNTSLGVQSLAQGQTVTETFAYQATDGIVSTPSTLTVTITGTNDAPVATVDTAAVQEDLLVAASGNVLINDSDVDQGTVLSVANAGTFAGAYGNLVLNVDGSYTYALNNAALSVQSLAQGQVVTETFAYQATDGIVSTPSILTVSITGTNDAPVTTVDTAAVQEDLSIAATGNVLTNDSDVDQGTVLRVANAGTFAGTYGSLVLNADGSYTYALNNAALSVQSLAQGQVVIETFAYQATDGIVSTPSTLTVTITGTNDAPVTTVDTATVQEDMSISASGNVLTNDSDIDQGTVLTVANAGVFAGKYGQLTLQANGSYTYALNNASLAVQSLAVGQIVNETFAYQASDGIVSTPSTLTVSIQGSNDAPVVAVPLSNQSAQQASPFSFALPANSFTDIDQGDMLNYAATLADGTALPSWITFNAATRTFSGTAGDPGSLALRVVATDLAGASVSSNFMLSVAQTCTPGKSIEGSCDNDTLTGTKGDDILDGQSGADTMTGGTGNDTYLVDNVNDKVVEKSNQGIDTIKSSVSYTLSAYVENLTLTGTAAINATDNAQNNLLTGNSANNVLTAGLGNDILRGGAGNDILKDSAGNNLLDGGTGSDTLTGGSGNEMFIGGAGNDTINTGNGADIIAFNRGDGADTINGGLASSNTISLGGGIRYADLALSKVNNDLILEVGSGEQLTLVNWYNSSANYKSVVDLQVMADAIAGFSATSSDPLMNRAVQNFDFTAIANAFDQARGNNSTLMHWQAANSLLAAHLSGSDTMALGGDLAHQYGMNGSMSGMNLIAAQDVLNVPQFGAQAQALRPLQGLQGGASM